MVYFTLVTDRLNISMGKPVELRTFKRTISPRIVTKLQRYSVQSFELIENHKCSNVNV